MPTILGFLRGGDNSFADQVDLTVDFGTSPDRWILLRGVITGADPGAGFFTSCVIDPDGANVALTLEADEYLGDFERVAWFRLSGSSVPSGSKVVRLICANNLRRLSFYLVHGHGGGTIAASSGGTKSGTGTSLSFNSQTSATDDLVVGIGDIVSGANALTITGQNSTTAVQQLLFGGDGDVAVGAHKAGASSVTLEATISGNQFTPAYWVRAWNVPNAVSGSPPQGTVTISAVDPATTTAEATYSYDDSDEDSFEARIDGGTPFAIGASPATITGLSPATSYALEIRAVNAFGEGGWSTPFVFTTASLRGFDFDTDPDAPIFGNLSGSPVGIALLASTNLRMYVHDANTGALVASDVVTTDASAMLSRWEGIAIADATPYRIDFETTDVDPLDRSTWSVIMTST